MNKFSGETLGLNQFEEMVFYDGEHLCVQMTRGEI